MRRWPACQHVDPQTHLIATIKIRSFHCIESGYLDDRSRHLISMATMHIFVRLLVGANSTEAGRDQLMLNRYSIPKPNKVARFNKSFLETAVLEHDSCSSRTHILFLHIEHQYHLGLCKMKSLVQSLFPTKFDLLYLCQRLITKTLISVSMLHIFTKSSDLIDIFSMI